MKVSNIMTAFAKKAAPLVFKVKRVSPELALFAGIGCGVAATVLACKATLKVEEVMSVHEEKIDKIHECWDKVQSGEIEPEKYTDLDHKKDLAVVYTQTGVDFLKLYGPSLALGTASIGLIIGGHYILKKRNVALIAAYKVVSEGFANYRKRVIAEHGEETDYMYKHNLYAEEVTEEAHVDADGVEHEARKVKKLAVKDPNNNGPYAKFFDESSTEWSNVPEYNMLFLRQTQNYYNDMLRAKGHVFLNEVYDALGIPRTAAGAIVGWVAGGSGDNFIDFGIFDGDNTKARDFVNGYEKSILLDFNVDGVIYDIFTKAKA